jgi:hypothetical protein
MNLARVLPFLLAFAACGEENLGKSCPMDDLGADIHDPSQQNAYPEVVEIDARFVNCDHLVCVSTSGSPAYCSKECRTDAGCPKAFECRAVSLAGNFADRQFCVWRACRVAFECGDLDRYTCERPDGEDTGVCGLKE